MLLSIGSNIALAQSIDCTNSDIDDDNDGLIEVCTLEGLDAIRHVLDGSGLKSSVNATTSTTGCGSGGCRGYELARNLDFSDDASYRTPAANKPKWTADNGWMPIGVLDNTTPIASFAGIPDNTTPVASYSGTFSGTFDGNGFTISNLRSIWSTASNVGLFARVSGTIKRVGLLNATVHGNNTVGSLVGWNFGGTVENSYNTGRVIANAVDVGVQTPVEVGGLVGYNDGGTITNSHSASAIEINGEGSLVGVGGLVGLSLAGSIKHSSSTIHVRTNLSNTGGLVGWNELGTIENSYGVGQIHGSGRGEQNNLGGLVGINYEGTIKNSFSAVLQAYGGETGEAIGGLVGFNSGGTISYSYSLGPVSTTSNFNSVGGLVGYNDGGKITNSCSASEEIIGNEAVGGLVGFNYNGTIENSCSASEIQGASLYVGGLVGYNRGSSSTIANSYNTGDITGLLSETTTPYIGTIITIIERPDYVGGLVGRNDDSNITDSYNTGNVESDFYVGGLVGFNSSGTITNSYNTGRIIGDSHVGGLVARNEYGKIRNSHSIGQVRASGDYAGGLVGLNDRGELTNTYSTGAVNSRGDYVGGLVGYNDSGKIWNSYSTGRVVGKSNIGGLVGYADLGEIKNSYSLSPVIQSYPGGANAGGLVGYTALGFIINSYSAGPVSGSNGVGGLVAADSFAGLLKIKGSYWDIRTSGLTSSVLGDGRGTRQLQAPTAAAGIYDNWDDTDWDFGNSNQYPTLKYSRGSDVDDPACGGTQQPTCGTLIKTQERVRQIVVPVAVSTQTLRLSPSPYPQEGETVVLSIDPKEQIRFRGKRTYQWRQISGITLPIQTSNTHSPLGMTTDTQLSFVIPPNFVSSNARRSNVMFRLEVTGENLATTRLSVVSLDVEKHNNGSAAFRIETQILPTDGHSGGYYSYDVQTTITLVDNDPDGNGNLGVAWFRCEVSVVDQVAICPQMTSSVFPTISLQDSVPLPAFITSATFRSITPRVRIQTRIDYTDKQEFNEVVLPPEFTPLLCSAVTTGQSRLFLYGTNSSAKTDFTLIADGEEQAIDSSTIEQISVDVAKITLKVPLASNQVSVRYQSENTIELATCSTNSERDSDQDGVVDITDANPFNKADTRRLPLLPAAPKGLSAWFHRAKVIPNVMQGDFSYIYQAQTNTTPEVVTLATGLTTHEYFGMPSEARLLIDKTTHSCRNIVRMAQSTDGSVRTRIDISNDCEDITAKEKLLAQSMLTDIDYYWVFSVDDILVSQAATGTLQILAPVNFIGQNSYFLERQNDDSLTAIEISSSDSKVLGTISQTVLAYVGAGPTISSSVNLNRLGDVLKGTYTVANKPPGGQSARYWLGSSAQVWAPTRREIKPMANGLILAPNTRLAIGRNNHIFVETGSSVILLRLKVFLEGALQ